jgi:hypothetical protein
MRSKIQLRFIYCCSILHLLVCTGEGAEEMVEDMPNIGKQIIHHEELAENLHFALCFTLLA